MGVSNYCMRLCACMFQGMYDFILDGKAQLVFMHE